MKTRKRYPVKEMEHVIWIYDEQHNVPHSNILGVAIRTVAVRIPKAIIFLN